MKKLKTELEQGIKELNLEFTDEIINNFFIYMNTLLYHNKNINLTAITDKNEIITKHFLDCLLIFKKVNFFKNSKIIDIGSGAGFPGIPMKIIRNDLDITLVDSLNKRINFLNTVIKELNLNKIIAIHERCEDIGKDDRYRENFDFATSRAVAGLGMLSEFCLPFVKIGGRFIALKGKNAFDEVEESKLAIKILGGEIEDIYSIKLPNTDTVRHIVVINKIAKTPEKYPRRASKINKKPIIEK